MGTRRKHCRARAAIHAAPPAKARQFDSERHTTKRSEPSLDIPISIVVPAFNESVSIISSVKALPQLEYPEYELIVVNDGSTDDTLEKLILAFNLRPFPEAYRAVVPCQPFWASRSPSGSCCLPAPSCSRSFRSTCIRALATSSCCI